MDDSQELLHELLRELADIRSDINKDGFTPVAKDF